MSFGIKHWPSEDRPREKLLKQGREHLTDAELLAIFLRTGVKGKSAVDLARQMLLRFGGLRQLCKASSVEFCALKGLGLAKYAQLQAALELSQRSFDETLDPGKLIHQAQEVIPYLRHQLGMRSKECLCVVFLNTKNKIIAFEIISEGTIDQASLHLRELVERVIAHRAKSIILAHNHPSGDSSPSEEDYWLTERVKEALALIDVRLLDHIIIGEKSAYAFSTHPDF